MIALITGITGQDGAYLAQLLLKNEYKVIGLVRSANDINSKNLNYLGITNLITFEQCDQSDLAQVINLLKKYNPNEIYNLAAHSSVGLSFQQPIATLQFNIISVINMLEAIRVINTDIRFYQASSSEMFGKATKLPIDFNTAIHPLSPYAISKATGHYTTINYRESYGLFACCGVLFNHESYLRAENFFLKKLIKGALDLHANKIEKLELGNLNVKRDFGYSPNYVEAMWLMLQQSTPQDYMICTGKSISLKEIVEYVFNKLNVDVNKIVIAENLMRPTDIEDIYGDNTNAKNELGWKVMDNFYEILNLIIAEEQMNYGK
jgi:GDPmannose 4,6-dehydratase